MTSTTSAVIEALAHAVKIGKKTVRASWIRSYVAPLHISFRKPISTVEDRLLDVLRVQSDLGYVTLNYHPCLIATFTLDGNHLYTEKSVSRLKRVDKRSKATLVSENQTMFDLVMSLRETLEDALFQSSSKSTPPISRAPMTLTFESTGSTPRLLPRVVLPSAYQLPTSYAVQDTDELLKLVVPRIKHLLREEDQNARDAGDRLVVLGDLRA